MNHHFETLGLDNNATQQEIQEAYERLSKELAPENNNNEDFFKDEYKKIQEAYNALSHSSILKNSGSTKSFNNTNSDKSNSNASGSVTVTISSEKIEELKNKKLDTIQTTSVPNGLKTLSVLSMIGSGFFALLFLRQTFSGFGGFGFNFLIFTVPFVLKFIGAMKMFKGKKAGYKTYLVPSIVFNVLLGSSIVTGYQNNNLIGSILFVGSMIIFSIIFYNYKDDLK